MGIQVTTLNPVAGVTSSRPRVSVVVTEPIASVNAALLAAAASSSVAGATVTAVVPISRLSYILMASSAQLDTTGRFQFIPDQVFVADVVAKGVSKSVRETFATQDYSTITYNKALADAVTFVENVVRTLTFIRSFADSVAPTDRPAISFSRPAADSFTTIDTKSITPQKRSFDTVGTSDSESMSFGKVSLDSISLQEQLARQVAKYATSQAMATDQASRSISKALASAFSLASFANRSVDRLVRDGVAMNDSADTVDGVAMQASKGVSNVVFTSDSDVISLAALKTETATISSVGLLVSQGYCDPTYFAEDYVGDSRTFS